MANPVQQTTSAASATAAAPAANGAGQAASGSARVTMPDQNGSFHLNVPRDAIKHVQVVDVDMVLQLQDGSKIVLAGGALGAMDDQSKVVFSDGAQNTGGLFDLVGKIVLQNTTQSPILNSDPGNANSKSNADNGVGAQDNHFVSDNPGQVNTNATSLLAKIITENAGSLTSNGLQNLALPSIPVPPAPVQSNGAESNLKLLSPTVSERSGQALTDPVVGPQTPGMNINLLNLTTITQVGSTLYGSGGSTASASDGSNLVQFATQVITAGDDVHTIYATGSGAQTSFVKIFEVNLTGDGTATSLKISGVPSNLTILNATYLGDGVYQVIPAAKQKSFDLQVQYTTTPADASQAVEATSTIKFDATVVTSDGAVTLSQSSIVVIKDASSYTDLSYLDPATGKSVWVLPAQGIPHEIHAGNGGVTIYGSNANDLLYGGAGSDTIIGGSGNTYFEGGAGADVLTGGTQGSNTAGYKGSGSGVTVDLSTGLGTGGDAQGDVLSNIQNLIGSAYDDTFVANGKANRLDGGSGGSDTVSYAASTAAVTVNLITNAGSGGYAAGDTYVHIQNVIGSAYSDLFIANSASSRFDGGSAGSDTVSFANISGAVTVDLGAGTGNVVTSNGTVAYTFAHIENLIGGSGDDLFVGNSDANSFDGGSGGNDTVSYANSSTAVTVNFLNGRGTGGDAEGDTYTRIQNVIGSAHDDVFVAGIDTVSFNGGSAGSDTVNYGASSSGIVANMVTMKGSSFGSTDNNTYINIQNIVGSGSADTFISGAAANHFDGGSGGSDTVSYAYSNAAVTVNLFTGNASGGYADGDTLVHIWNVVGSNYDDMFIASSDTNFFDGGGGTNNTVSYANSVAGVTIDLTNTSGTGTSGAYATGDSFVNIQSLIGSVYDDTFVSSADANTLDGGVSGSGSHNRVSYAASTSAVTVDLNASDGSGTSGGYATGDKLINIQDLTGSIYDDTFIASAAANYFDGGISTSASHNRVSYIDSTAGVTVNLITGNGSGGYAEGDTYANIQDVTGGSGDDTFIANAVNNNFDGGVSTNTSHNRVSYVNSSDSVTVNLFTGIGSGGFADGDTYLNIQDVTGGASDDTFIASAASNYFDGGNSTTASHNRVSYINSTAAVTVNLFTGNGSGGFADGDTYLNIQDVTGGQYDDTFVATAANNNFDGGVSTNTSHNRVSYVNATGAVTVNLFTGNGSGSFADGDTYTNIQDVTGGSSDDTFIASAAANYFDGGVSTSTSHNLVSYVNSTGAVTVNLVSGLGSGGFAAGDTYANIQDVTGGQYDDTFVATAANNNFDGGVSTNTSHNRVSYVNATGAVTVNLFTGNGSGSFADGDTYTNIQDVTGGSSDDTFIASAAANYFDGGTSTSASHNLVSYVNSTGAVTVNLVNGLGSGGFADGDTYANIQDVTGGQYDDTFVATAANNNFDGGVSTNTSHNRVSYVNATGAVTVNLFTGNGSGSFADGDTYTNIQDVTGGSSDDTFIASAAANYFDGGTSTNTSHNRVSYVNATGAVTVNLFTGNGSGSFADGDTYLNIQDVTGGASDDTFVASAAANYFDGGTSTNTSHNRVSYVNSTGAVTVDLINGNGSGGFAAGDTYANIQDVTGGQYDDTFIATAAANYFDGGTSSNTSHNRVSYIGSTAAVTVDLFNGNGSGGYAAGDTYTNIQDVTGGSGDDTFIATAAANYFDGGTSTNTSHNRVSYVNSADAVTVDLIAGTGSGGYAAGDTYANIQDVTGGSGDDTFIATAAANYFDGGTSTNISHNRVSYVNATGAVTINLFTGNGSGSFADGDTYTNIQDVTGGSSDDTFIASAAANYFDGGTSTNISHNRVSYVNATGAVTVNLFTGNGSGSFADGDTYTNIQDVTGGSSDDTFIASAAANYFDGGTSTNTSHNRVSYVNSTGAVTVDLINGNGSGGFADGDTYANIQDVTGGSGDDTFVATAAANYFDGGTSSNTSHNRVSYAGSTAAVTVDLFNGNGSGGYAAGDTYTNIQDVTGGSGDDTFIATAAANYFDGGTSTNISHNRVSYVNSTGAVTVDLINGNGSGGFAAGDTYANIQDVTGGQYDDTFIATAAANYFDGGTSTNISHNRVSYASSTDAVTVNLFTGNGSGGYAEGDTYLNIQDVTGGTGDDTFIATLAANYFDGGTSTNTSHNRVSYVNSTGAVTVNLFTGNGSGSFAANDTYTNIQDVTGGSSDDTFIASAAANYFDGGTSTNTSHNLVSYINSTAAVTVNLFTGNGTGGFADGDTYVNIQDVTGSSSSNDVFIASAAANKFDGNGGSHNQVSYVNSTAGVTVDLSTTTGTGSGGFAAGDTYVNIQDVVGSQYDDIFIASSSANAFDGGSGSNTVSYAGSSTAITVNLASGAAGSGGNAAGDTYTNIQNVIGGSGADSLTAASSGVTTLTGGGGGDTLTGIEANRANTYASYATSSSGVTVDLTNTTGSGTSGGDAAGDKLSFINNLIGSSSNDIFIANDQANILDGGAGTDTVSYKASTGAVIVDLSNTTGAGTSGNYAQGDRFSNIENVIGSDYDDKLTGAAAGNSVLTGGAGADTLIGIGSGNVASYSTSTLGVTVDLQAGLGTNGDAQGDVLTNIYNIIGSAQNDTFVASSQSNSFVGGGGVDTVSYIHSTSAVTVDLTSTTGSGTSGGYAIGDTFANISNLIGSNYDDTFYASSVANNFDGGASVSAGNTVSYARSSVGVVVDLFHGTGSDAVTGVVSYASGDVYSHIQNVVGTSGNDTFYASADANKFTGGGGTDTVSYLYTNSGNSIVADLFNGGTSGDASGDSYINILNLTGSQYIDSTLIGNANGNTLVAMGSTTTNTLNGGAESGSTGTDTLDARLGGHNTLIAGTGANIFIVSAHNTDAGISNLVSADGTPGTSTTLQFQDLSTNLNVSLFSGSVKGITTMDISSSTNTNVVISSADIEAMTANSAGNHTLTITLHNTESIQVSTATTEYYRSFASGDIVFYSSSSYATEVARIHLNVV